jgi:hypothetical protein
MQIVSGRIVESTDRTENNQSQRPEKHRRLAPVTLRARRIGHRAIKYRNRSPVNAPPPLSLETECGSRDSLPQETEAPAGSLQQGLRLTNLLVYLAQQWPIQQQLPPLSQQSAEREVAFAVPISAMAARIANRYFIKSSC